MTNAELKALAKARLKNNWGTAILVILLQGVITYVVGIALPGIGNIASLILSGPLTFGVTYVYVQFSYGQSAQVGDAFKGFSYFGNTFLLYLLRAIFVALWSLLLVVPGIMKAYSYAMATYLMVQEPSISAQDALKKSEQCMKGHRMEMFMLVLSFFGWWMLCIVTFGVATLFVAPYLNETLILFFQQLNGNMQQNYHGSTEENRAMAASMPAEASGRAGETTVLNAGSLPTAPVYQTEAETGVFTGITGGLAKQVFALPDGALYAVGRDAEASGILTAQDNSSVSRCHCTIRYSQVDDCYFLMDRSANGTFVNGIRLPKEIEQRIEHGTLVSLGDGRESFRLE